MHSRCAIPLATFSAFSHDFIFVFRSFTLCFCHKLLRPSRGCCDCLSVFESYSARLRELAHLPLVLEHWVPFRRLVERLSVQPKGVIISRGRCAKAAWEPGLGSREDSNLLSLDNSLKFPVWQMGAWDSSDRDVLSSPRPGVGLTPWRTSCHPQW